MPYNYGNYIPVKDRESIPHNVYMQVVYIVKDYHRMLRERDNIMFGSSAPDGPRGPGVSDPTGNKAVRLSVLASRVDGIDNAIHDTNATYSENIRRGDVAEFDSLEAFADYGYFCYALYDPETAREPSTRTWKRFRAGFAYKVAQNLNLI